MWESPHRDGAHPVRTQQPDGARCVCGAPLVSSDERCIERERGGAAQRAHTITLVWTLSSTEVILFFAFLRAVEGPVWWPERAITPFLAPLVDCQQCFQRNRWRT